MARALVAPTSISLTTVTVYAGMRLATMHSHTLVVEAVGDGEPEELVGTKKQKMLWNIVEQSGSDLSPGERDIFYNLLVSYADVLACSTSDLGRTDQ